MARFLTETYGTGSFLNGKTADLGGTWAAVATVFDSGSDTPISAGTVSVSDTTFLAFKNNATPGSANEDVSGEFTPTADNWGFAISLRRSSSTGAQYLCLLSPSVGVYLTRLSSGTDWPGTLIGSASSPIVASNRATHTLRASITGNTLRMWVDGSAITFTESGTTTVSDSTITAANEVGWWGRAITSTEFSGDDDISGDTTPPTLSSPGASGGVLSCSGSVSTNEGNGTLYAVFTASATAPTGVQVEAGQDHTGAAALRAASQAVSGTGTQSIGSGSITAGTRYAHYMHKDAAGNRSSVVSSTSFNVTSGGGGTPPTPFYFRLIQPRG